jgi:hypothetical protein
MVTDRRIGAVELIRQPPVELLVRGEANDALIRRALVGDTKHEEAAGIGRRRSTPDEAILPTRLGREHLLPIEAAILDTIRGEQPLDRGQR